MIRTCTVLVLSLMIVGSSGRAHSFSRPPAEVIVTMDGRLNYPYISSNGGPAYLQISLATSDVRLTDRSPLNVAVVLDRSGSMGDQGKIEYAKAALYKLIDQLASDDILSIVIYDDIVDVLRRAQRVGNKAEIKLIVDEVYPRNATNLGGGMVEGFRQVKRFAGKGYTNRVILLSDGLANRGTTDPSELNRIARRYRTESISLTAMGVGLDYNENLMVGLSESGGGNYYFIESPSSLASIMNRELHTISSVVAQNAFIELKLGRGVRIRDIVGCEYKMENGRYIIQVGDLYANECREFTVNLDIPEGSGSLVAARGKLKYDRSIVRVGRVEGFSATVQYTRDAAVIEKNRDLEAQAQADVAASTRKVENAMRALDEGRREDAEAELKEARAFILSSPAASVGGEVGAVIKQQEEKLRGYADSLADDKDGAQRAKKAIQYDNYRTQKKR